MRALRLIEYAVGKSDVKFKREMQRHSMAISQLFHYKKGTFGSFEKKCT